MAVAVQTTDAEHEPAAGTSPDAVAEHRAAAVAAPWPIFCPPAAAETAHDAPADPMARQAEIDEHRFAGRAEHDVAGLEVEVHHMLAMQRVQGRGDLDADLAHLFIR